MVELVLVSVGIVAVVLFLTNLRSMRSESAEHRLLHGNPQWVSGAITSVQQRGEYLGFVTAKLEIELGGKTHEVSGPLPKRYADDLVAGLSVQGHVEYDMLDTLRTDLWDASPAAVLTECGRLLGVSATLSVEQDLHELTFSRGGRTVTVWLADDGWVSIMVPPRFDDLVISVDLRADFDEAENAHMVTEQLGATRDQAAEHIEFLSNFAPDTLGRIEAFVTGVQGWVCIDNEAIEFECGLPFAEGEMLADFVDEAIASVALIDRDAATEQVVGDGAW